MFRYLGLMWDSHDAPECETARRLQAKIQMQRPDLAPVLLAPGLAVYWGGRRPGSFQRYLLSDSSGVVLGRLFGRLREDYSAPESPELIDDASSQQIVRTQAQQLIQQFWGHYVAFVRDPVNGSAFVLRDPAGGIPCHLTTHKGVHIAFSSLQDCIDVGLGPFAINWDYVAARMVLPYVHGKETGLTDVLDLAPGQCMVLRRGLAPERRLYWKPAEIANSDWIEDFETAASTAHKTVQACVEAWARGYPRIVLKLSGGVDSSIVLACLRACRSPDSLSCVTYYDHSVWSDERRFARLAAREMPGPAGFACRLLERERLAESMDAHTVTSIPASTRPRVYIKLRRQRAQDIPVAREENAALFSGLHGDGLFFTLLGFSAADYAYRHGIGRSLLPIAHATALGCGKATWRVIPAALREARHAREVAYGSSHVQHAARRRVFVNPAVIDDVLAKGDRYLRLPWIPPGQHLAPGKAEHVRMMCWPASLTSPLERSDDPDWVSPLASQPIMELFLRIPTYVLTAHGQNRAVIRRAFADALPPEILSRRSKGAGNHMTLTVFRKNEALYRDMLLGGILASRGLLDRTAVERFFDIVNDPGADGVTELLQFHFNQEIWVRSWMSGQRSAANA